MKALCVAAAANAMPISARQFVTKPAKPRDARYIEYESKHCEGQQCRKFFLSAQRQCLRQKIYPEKWQQYQDQHHDKTDQQLFALARPFQPVIDKFGFAPEILPFARRRPEPVNAQRDDGEQQVG